MMLNKLNYKQRENLAGYSFIMPAVIVFLLFILYPFLYSFYLSMQESTGIKLTDIKFGGLIQYKRAFADLEFYKSLLNTVVYTFPTVFFQMAIGLFLAVLLNRHIKGRMVYRTAIFTPVVMSTIVCGIIWCWLYSPDESGLINRSLSIFGIKPIAWLRDPRWAMLSIIIMSIWKWIGYHMTIYIAAIQGISHDYYEAASIEGANSWQQFKYITFPLLSGATWLLLITSIINTFQIFDQIFVMTKGGPLGATTVIVYFIYKKAFVEFNLPYASAVAWLLFAVIFILTLIQMRVKAVADNE